MLFCSSFLLTRVRFFCMFIFVCFVIPAAREKIKGFWPLNGSDKCVLREQTSAEDAETCLKQDKN